MFVIYLSLSPPNYDYSDLWIDTPHFMIPILPAEQNRTLTLTWYSNRDGRMIVPSVLVPVETVLCDVVRGVSTLPGVLLLCMEDGVDG